jgi:hypothetical protein
MIDFDFASVTTVEFGVGVDARNRHEVCLVPVDTGVQQALTQMAMATKSGMQQRSADSRTYEPAECYGSCEHLSLALEDDLAEQIRLIHQATNVSFDTGGLSQPSQIFCYFAHITDRHSRRLTAIRRSTQFKGILKSRLIRIFTDTLKIVEDKIFKLDEDFDLLVDGHAVYIFRPAGFEFIGKLQGAILSSVPRNIAMIREDLQFIDFAVIEEYARTHVRAARYLASIRVQKEARNIDQQALQTLCRRTGVVIQEVAGKITVEPPQVLGFLEVLDRRRYEVELVKDVQERFRASSRQRIGQSAAADQKLQGNQTAVQSLRKRLSSTLIAQPLPALPSEDMDH